MPFNKEELLKLPDDEKIALAEALWSSIEEKHLPASDEEIAFAEERLRLYQENPGEEISVEEFKKRFANRYGL